jgi:predicted nucleotide-binding protein
LCNVSVALSLTGVSGGQTLGEPGHGSGVGKQGAGDVACLLCGPADNDCGYKTEPCDACIPLKLLTFRRHAQFQRNETIPPPNEFPRLFIISSTEAVFTSVWNEGVFFAGGYSLEALEKAVSESDFAIAIAQPHDIVEVRGIRQSTLRDNVLFELGLFMGKLSRHRALLIHPTVDGLKLPSDLHGLTALRYAPGEPATLAHRLQPACDQIRTIVKNLGVRTLLSRAAGGHIQL